MEDITRGNQKKNEPSKVASNDLNSENGKSNKNKSNKNVKDTNKYNDKTNKDNVAAAESPSCWKFTLPECRTNITEFLLRETRVTNISKKMALRRLPGITEA